MNANVTNAPVRSTAGAFNLKANTALSDAAATLTAAQLVRGIFTITPTVARVLTTDTAANIIAELKGYVVGSHFEFTVVNNAAFDVTLVAGDGVAIVGKTMINNSSGIWRLRIDSDTAVTIYTEAAGGGANATINRFSYLAAALQTSFAATYDVGFADVYLNGIKLVIGDDFTALTGTSIELTVGTSLNDNVEIIGFGSFTVANTYTKAEIDASRYTKAEIDLTVSNLATKAANSFTGQQTSSAGEFNLKTITVLSDTSAVLTGEQLDGGVFTITPTAARVLTTDSAVNILAAIPGYTVGSHFEFTVVNNAAFSVTLSPGAGVTLVGKTVINNGSGTWRLRVDSSLAVSIYTEASATPEGGRNFTAAGAITAAGKALILNYNGTVSQSAIASHSVTSSNTFNASNSKWVSNIYDAASDKFVIFYSDQGNSNYGTAVVATITGTAVAYGDPVVFAAEAITQIASAYDPVAQKTVVVYANAAGNGIVKVCTLTETVPSFGAGAATGQACYNSGVCFDKYAGCIVVVLRNTNLVALTGIISGTTISLSAATTIIGGATNGYTMSVVHCDSLQRNAFCYNTSARATIGSFTVNTTTYAVTTGSSIFVNNSQGSDGYANGERSIAWIEHAQRLAVLHGGGPTMNYTLHCVTHQFSAGAWAFSAYVQVSGNFFSAPYQGYCSLEYNAVTQSLAVSYPDPGVGSTQYFGKLKFTNILTATTISFASETQYESTFTEYTSLASNGSKGQVLLGYTANSSGGSGPARTVVGIAPLVDKRSQFIGFSQAAVSDGGVVNVQLPFSVDANQSGLTPNSAYYLSASNGSTLTTTLGGPKVGVAISANAVLIAGPNNG